jgi:hypothetical protein
MERGPAPLNRAPRGPSSCTLGCVSMSPITRREEQPLAALAAYHRDSMLPTSPVPIVEVGLASSKEVKGRPVPPLSLPRKNAGQISVHHSIQRAHILAHRNSEHNSWRRGCVKHRPPACLWVGSDVWLCSQTGVCVLNPGGQPTSPICLL